MTFENFGCAFLCISRFEQKCLTSNIEDCKPQIVQIQGFKNSLAPG